MTSLPRPLAWLLIAAGVAAALLAAVHLLQSFGGYTPCALCLRQREVLWTVAAVALGGWVLGRRRPVLARVAVVAVAVGFAVGAVVAGWHAGIEWKWWPGPPCAASVRTAVGAGDITAMLNGARPLHPVACDEAALRIAGLSLAGWNALLSAALSLLSLAVLAGRERP